MTHREEFLAGERPEDVHVFLSEEAVSDPDALAESAYGERADGGVVLVLPGEEARDAFRNATGIDVMGFAQTAMDVEGTIDRGCTSASCPDGEGSDHRIRFVFAFAEEQNEEVGGLYAEGDVIHAYASCSCGTAFSDKWTVDAE